MRSKLISAVTLMLAATTVTACQTNAGGAASRGAPGICRPDAAEALRGMHRMTDRQAMQRTGATIVRQIVPGQGVTMDYRRERVTIETDPKTGKIVRAACG